MTEHDPTKIGGVLLAAGGSTRFGPSKQLARFEGSTLIRRAATALAGSECDAIIVVLGHEADACRAELEGLDVDLCVNDNWRAGMSGSLKFGLEHLRIIEPELDAFIVTLVDQPLITTEIIDRLVAEYRRIRPLVVAAEYNGIFGVPALFARDMFDNVMDLQGDKGAQVLIRSAPGRVVSIALAEAAYDIDTPADIGSAREAMN
jgi:molybdenum cofactor cytidylyltransferase